MSLQFSSMNSQIAEAEHVDVGERLRAIRRLRRATLKTVADRAGLSRELPEPGRARPCERERRVSPADRRGARRQRDRPLRAERIVRPSTCAPPRVTPDFAFGTLGRKFMLTPRPLENLQVIVGELDAGGSTGDEPYTHGDSEERWSFWRVSCRSSWEPRCSSSRPVTPSTTGARLLTGGQYRRRPCGGDVDRQSTSY